MSKRDIFTGDELEFLNKDAASLTDDEIDWAEGHIAELKNGSRGIPSGALYERMQAMRDHINVARSHRAQVAREAEQARIRSTHDWRTHLLAIAEALAFMERADAPDHEPVMLNPLFPTDERLTQQRDDQLDFIAMGLDRDGELLEAVGQRNASMRRAASVLKGRAKRTATEFVDGLDADLADAERRLGERRAKLQAERERRADEQRRQQESAEIRDNIGATIKALQDRITELERQG